MDKVPSGLLMHEADKIGVFDIQTEGNFTVSVLFYDCGRFLEVFFSIATTSGNLASATCC